MKAAVIHSFGSADVLTLEDVAVPTPAGGEVLVQVHAASVNPADYKIRSGQYAAAKQEAPPLILGRDVAGTVETCGAGVAGFRRGEAVYALLDREHGGYAEYTIVNERDLARKPASLDYTEAAAVPLAALTAWQGLFDHGALKSGRHVLIHGGAGGVGHFAIQFAKSAGAKVSTTVSGRDFEFVRELGADSPVDYHSERFEDLVHDVDLVFDLVGGPTQDRSWSVLKRGGTLISSRGKPDENTARKHGVRAANFLTKQSASQLEEIGRLIDEGKVRPHVEVVYRLADVRSAQQRLEHEHVRGKVVLEVAP
jgi:NADPH:quinone reductase-like Zn-dependent oxidoreductase